jgi:molybdate transport system ATP-binding protein
MLKPVKSFNVLLNEISASGISIIMATSTFELPDVVTNVAVLDNGSISQSLTKQEFETSEHSVDRETRLISKALKQLIKHFCGKRIVTANCKHGRCIYQIWR